MADLKYRYQILTEDGQEYEGWGNNIREVVGEMQNLNPGLNFEVFPFGMMPEYLGYAEVQSLKKHYPDDYELRRVIRHLDEIVKLTGADSSSLVEKWLESRAGRFTSF